MSEMDDSLNGLVKKTEEILKENEQLKSLLEEYRKAIKTSLDKMLEEPGSYAYDILAEVLKKTV